MIPDQIIRSKRRTLSITVDGCGRVVVRAPRSCSDERIFSFLQSHQKWIEKRVEQAKAKGAYLPQENLDGYVFSLLGAPVRICLYDGGRCALNEDTGELFLPKTNAEKRLIVWLKAYAKAILWDVLERRASQMGVKVKSLSITQAKTRWGSCSANGAVHFSFRLIYCPIDVLDYVVVHELSHLFFPNHQKEFWDKVADFCPDWKTKRQYLKDHAYYMQIF